MSINLKVEEYCHNCPDFVPDTEVDYLHQEGINPITYKHEDRSICETTIKCKHKKRCAAQMRYLQKQHTEMMKKETGDESN